MEKSTFSDEYGEFLRELRLARVGAGLTQQQVAQAMGRTQSFVSKCERGERRIDIIELAAYCTAMGVSLSEFVARLGERSSPQVSRARARGKQ
jgi:transcriptional regulator with XRE-family HTH domain